MELHKPGRTVTIEYQTGTSFFGAGIQRGMWQRLLFVTLAHTFEDLCPRPSLCGHPAYWVPSAANLPPIEAPLEIPVDLRIPEMEQEKTQKSEGSGERVFEFGFASRFCCVIWGKLLSHKPEFCHGLLPSEASPLTVNKKRPKVQIYKHEFCQGCCDECN